MRKEDRVARDHGDDRRPLGEHRRVEPLRVRGGVSLWAILTGVVVAFGAMFLLSALIGGVLTQAGIDANEVAEGVAADVGLGVGIAMIAAMFLAYLWGGYTAGRMGRGAGAVNGFLVPLVAIIIAVIVAAIVNALGATANLNVPFTESRLPFEEGSQLVEFGQGIGIGMLIAMFVGGILGGMGGSRWHTKLERKAVDEREAEVEAEERSRLDREREREREVSAKHERETSREEPPRTGGAAAAPATRPRTEQEQAAPAERPAATEDRPPENQESGMDRLRRRFTNR
jgi:hypothetical protein